jgi:alpha-D-ribose 1-methylphosphonate 5-triphosphate synthase subunit PhnG
MYIREQRFEALAMADPSLIEVAANQILATHEVAILREPVPASIMMRATETAEGSVFNLGEVTVTEAEVEISGERGYAMVVGLAPAHALSAAILDAAYEADPGARDGIDAVLDAAIAATRHRHAAEWARLADTRVAFDELPQ